MKLVAVGDISLGDFPLTLGFGVRSTLENTRSGLFGKDIEEIFRNADFCFGNLETVISDINYNPNNLQSAQMRGSISAGRLLASGGLNVLSVANNHTMQHGAEAFEDTLTHLKALHIAPVGVASADGRSIPYLNKTEGEVICFLGYSMRPEKYNDPALYSKGTREMILDDIEHYKNKCNYLVLSLHWGDEFVDFPSHYQVLLAREFINAGAKIILGHHPHIVQGVERYKDGVIAYSLGNFIFDFWQTRLVNSMILEVSLRGDIVENLKIWPIRINDNYAPQLLHGDQAELLLKRYNKISNNPILKNEQSSIECIELAIKKYNRSVKLRLIENKIQNRMFFLRNLHKYKHGIVKQSIASFIYNNPSNDGNEANLRNKS